VTPSEAKEILVLYRPEAAREDDPAIAEALELARHDEELRRWFEEHCAYHAAVRSRFSEIEVPAARKEKLRNMRIVAGPKSWWRQPATWAAAAAVAVFIGLGAMWFRTAAPDRFTDYQSRMIRTVLREYRMDIRTNDMGPVRQYLSKRGAPADYVIPARLAQLQLTGGGLLHWRSKPVAMVCFNRGDNEMLFLFVMNESGLKDPPPAIPTAGKVNKLVTVSWTSGGKAYILAGPDEPEFARKYF
jgi:uncharacterized membrane protein YbaN (DUF454 family)